MENKIADIQKRLDTMDYVDRVEQLKHLESILFTMLQYVAIEDFVVDNDHWKKLGMTEEDIVYLGLADKVGL